MHLLCVIPARIGSRRLREKPLCLLAGEPMIRVVARRVLGLGLECPVVVASDDPRVIEAVAMLGVGGVLTNRRHRCGTERVAEVVTRPAFRDVEVVVNVQGDEPMLPAAAVAGALERVRRGNPIGTAGAPLTTAAMSDRNRVKVVVDGAGRALRFSRAYPASASWGCDVKVLHHVGVYAYTREALLAWTALPLAPGEVDEGLEQLRPLAHGMTVGVARIGMPVAAGVDSVEDLARVEAGLR